MVDTDYIISVIKKKTDRIMELTDPKKPIITAPITIGGKYTEKFDTFLQPGWTHSFFLGNVAYMYICSGEKKYLDYLEDNKQKYIDYLYHNDGEIGHDTGFLYSLYAVAMYEITGDEEYKNLALKAADEIAKRFRYKAGHIQAFFDLRKRGVQDGTTLMIVDDMMNMQLLMWAYRETGHSFYRDVYESHIKVAVKNLIRSDYSVCHAYHFDALTGEPLCEMNYCGFSVGSHWSRGTAWVIYGLAKAYEFTGCKERYLQPLLGVIGKYLESLDGGVIPMWDFRLPGDTDRQYRDTSAAAIIASAFKTLEKTDFGGYYAEKTKEYSDAVLRELCSEKWMCNDDSEAVLDYGNKEGSLWGDYFFTELVMKNCLGEKFIDFWN